MSTANNRLSNIGRVGFLTDTQQSTLETLKKEMSSEGWLDPIRHEDHLLCRFLRARKFDLTKSKKMLHDYEKWYKETKVEEIYRSFEFAELDQVHAIYPRYYHKTDKLGRPIYIESLGKLNVKLLQQVTSMDRLCNYYIKEYEVTRLERFPGCTKAAGINIETSFTILDLKGVSLMQFPSVFSFVKQISSIAQDYYPETLGKMFIINSPMIFSSIWSMIKPLLDEVTVNKIEIWRGGYEQKLLEYVDAENLPIEFGGKCTCEGGCDKGDSGPWLAHPIGHK